jgi:uncharacterized protein (TIGR02594 family)
MPLVVRQLPRSADRIGIRGAVAAGVVIAVVATSLTGAVYLDPLLRKFAPNADQQIHPAPVVSVPRSGAPAPRVAVAPPSDAPARTTVAPAPAVPPPAASPITPSPVTPVPNAAAAPRPAVTPVPPPPIAHAPEQTARTGLPETVAAPPPRPRPAEVAEEDEARSARSRDSRHQVARNVRNQRSERYEEAATTLASASAYAIVSEARRYIGTNPTSMARLWCARFTNFVLTRSGYRGTGSDAALSFAQYGRRVAGPRVGAIAVMRRKGGGHVGIVSGVDRHGNPILISGNNGRYGVAERVYPRRRIIAYVMPLR